MAQNYGVDIQRWNGQDYDTILPTPDAHASTHQANGSDPLILQTGNYGNKTITNGKLADGVVSTGKIANNAVTRAKLAKDALYSPFKEFDSSGVLTISIDDIGRTIRSISGTTDYTINVSRNTNIPAGAEIAIFRQQAKTLNIVFASNTQVAIPGETTYETAPTLTIGTFEMVALKKLASDSNSDYWLVTGNVEVVS